MENNDNKEKLKIVTEKKVTKEPSTLVPYGDKRKIILTRKRSPKTKIKDVMKDCLIK